MYTVPNNKINPMVKNSTGAKKSATFKTGTTRHNFRKSQGRKTSAMIKIFVGVRLPNVNLSRIKVF